MGRADEERQIRRGGERGGHGLAVDQRPVENHLQFAGRARHGHGNVVPPPRHDRTGRTLQGLIGGPVVRRVVQVALPVHPQRIRAVAARTALVDERHPVALEGIHPEPCFEGEIATLVERRRVLHVEIAAALELERVAAHAGHGPGHESLGLAEDDGRCQVDHGHDAERERVRGRVVVAAFDGEQVVARERERTDVLVVARVRREEHTAHGVDETPGRVVVSDAERVEEEALSGLGVESVQLRRGAGIQRARHAVAGRERDGGGHVEQAEGIGTDRVAAAIDRQHVVAGAECQAGEPVEAVGRADIAARHAAVRTRQRPGQLGVGEPVEQEGPCVRKAEGVAVALPGHRDLVDDRAGGSRRARRQSRTEAGRPRIGDGRTGGTIEWQVQHQTGFGTRQRRIAGGRDVGRAAGDVPEAELVDGADEVVRPVGELVVAEDQRCAARLARAGGDRPREERHLDSVEDDPDLTVGAIDDARCVIPASGGDDACRGDGVLTGGGVLRSDPQTAVAIHPHAVGPVRRAVALQGDHAPAIAREPVDPERHLHREVLMEIDGRCMGDVHLLAARQHERLAERGVRPGGERRRQEIGSRVDVDRVLPVLDAPELEAISVRSRVVEAPLDEHRVDAGAGDGGQFAVRADAGREDVVAVRPDDAPARVPVGDRLHVEEIALADLGRELVGRRRVGRIEGAGHGDLGRERRGLREIEHAEPVRRERAGDRNGVRAGFERIQARTIERIGGAEIATRVDHAPRPGHRPCEIAVGHAVERDEAIRGDRERVAVHGLVGGQRARCRVAEDERRRGDRRGGHAQVIDGDIDGGEPVRRAHVLRKCHAETVGEHALPRRETAAREFDAGVVENAGAHHAVGAALQDEPVPGVVLPREGAVVAATGNGAAAGEAPIQFIVRTEEAHADPAVRIRLVDEQQVDEAVDAGAGRLGERVEAQFNAEPIGDRHDRVGCPAHALVVVQRVGEAHHGRAVERLEREVRGADVAAVVAREARCGPLVAECRTVELVGEGSDLLVAHVAARNELERERTRCRAIGTPFHQHEVFTVGL